LASSFKILSLEFQQQNQFDFRQRSSCETFPLLLVGIRYKCWWHRSWSNSWSLFIFCLGII